MKQKIDKAFISEHDKFLHQFDKATEKSASQLKEYDKYQRIYSLRDGKKPASQPSLIKVIFSRLFRVFIKS